MAQKETRFLVGIVVSVTLFKLLGNDALVKFIGEKTVLLAIYIQKCSFCQDRLGTNIRENSKKDWRLKLTVSFTL